MKGCGLYSPPPPPLEGVRNFNGKGVQEEAISKEVGLDSRGLFFPGTLKQELLFLFWWSYINS